MKQFLANEKRGKKKNAFHFTLKAISILKIFHALSKYDTRTWATNNCNRYIVLSLEKYDKETIKFGQLLEKNMRNIFFSKNHTSNAEEKLLPVPSLKNREYLWIYSVKFYVACFC